MMRRRGLLLGLAGLITAPALVRAESLMKISVPKPWRTITGIDYASGPDLCAVTWDTGPFKAIGYVLYPHEPLRGIRLEELQVLAPTTPPPPLDSGRLSAWLAQELGRPDAAGSEGALRVTLQTKAPRQRRVWE